MHKGWEAVEPGLSSWQLSPAQMELAWSRISEGIGILDAQRQVRVANKNLYDILQITNQQTVRTFLDDWLTNSVPIESWQKRQKVHNHLANTRQGIPVWLDIEPLDKAEWLVIVRSGKETMLAEQLELAQRRLTHLETELAKHWRANNYYQSMSPERHLLKQVKDGIAFDKFIGVNETVMAALSLAAKAAKVQSTILITGDSGTGKEVLAEGIHLSSPRKSGPFIKVNCAALPLQLLESELFGHEKGAFTGAIRRKQGKFELAHGGTLFLDEIGELELAMQSKLLRVLQTSCFERVGGESTLQVDVRIIAATNRNLAEMVMAKTFREDLYYRLHVIPLSLPPLRERREDIPLLVDHFLKYFNRAFGREVRGICQEAMNMLLAYDWPGNVRELRNLVERLVALTEEDYIGVDDLPQHLTALSDDRRKSNKALLASKELFPLEEYEKEVLRAALEQYKSFSAAGKVLGITHKTVAAKAQKYGLLQVEQSSPKK